MNLKQVKRNFTNRLYEELMMIVSRPMGPTFVEHYKLHSQTRRTLVGKHDDKAEHLAGEWLAFAESHKDDKPYFRILYGEAIHFAHLAVGLIAIEREQIEKAKGHLVASATTPGSPRLNSYGPNTRLARKLLEKGELNVVLTFLDLVEKFWATDNDPRFSNSVQNHQHLLEQWRKDVKQGKVPDHPQWKD